MIAMRSEINDTDVRSYVVNERAELAELHHEWNNEKIGHGSDCICLSDKSVHLYDETTHTWVEL